VLDNLDNITEMASELVKQNKSYDIRRFPRSAQIGPLSYGDWDLKFLSFFLSFSEQSYGEDATKVIQGNAHYLVDQFLTVDQADLDACYEAHQERGVKKIDKWGMTLLAFFEMFNNHAAKNLGHNPDEIKFFTYAFLGVRAAQAAFNMKGEVELATLEALNSQQWLGHPAISVKLFQ